MASCTVSTIRLNKSFSRGIDYNRVYSDLCL